MGNEIMGWNQETAGPEQTCRACWLLPLNALAKQAGDGPLAAAKVLLCTNTWCLLPSALDIACALDC